MVIVLSASRPVAAAEPLRLGLTPVADDCARWLKGRKHDAVVIGTISGPQTYPTSSGPGIRLALGELLQEREIAVKDRADIAVTLSYKPREVPDARNPKLVRLVVDLRIVFIDNRERELDDLEKRIEHEEAVRLILGLSHDPGGKFDAAAANGMALGFFHPKAYLDGSVVLAGDKSPFGVELLVADKPVKAEDREGLAFVPVPREQEYTVKLVNRSPLEMGVRLTIDGLSAVLVLRAAAPAQLPDGKANPLRGQPACDLVIVPARSEVIVPGWLISTKKVLGFKVMDYPQTAVAQLGQDRAPTGTITATFSASWEKDPPADEPPGTRGPGDNGTGFGQPKEIEGEVVQPQGRRGAGKRERPLYPKWEVNDAVCDSQGRTGDAYGNDGGVAGGSSVHRAALSDPGGTPGRTGAANRAHTQCQQRDVESGRQAAGLGFG